MHVIKHCGQRLVFNQHFGNFSSNLFVYQTIHVKLSKGKALANLKDQNTLSGGTPNPLKFSKKSVLTLP
jgi:hypothetical protein